MSAIDDIRKVIQDFLAPELRAIHARMESLEKMTEMRFAQMQTNHESVMRELALDKRLSKLEDKLDNASAA